MSIIDKWATTLIDMGTVKVPTPAEMSDALREGDAQKGATLLVYVIAEMRRQNKTRMMIDLVEADDGAIRYVKRQLERAGWQTATIVDGDRAGKGRFLELWPRSEEDNRR